MPPRLGAECAINAGLEGSLFARVGVCRFGGGRRVESHHLIFCIQLAVTYSGRQYPTIQMLSSHFDYQHMVFKVTSWIDSSACAMESRRAWYGSRDISVPSSFGSGSRGPQMSTGWKGQPQTQQ